MKKLIATTRDAIKDWILQPWVKALLDVESIAAIEKNQLQLEEHVIYKTQSIEGLGNQFNVFDSNDKDVQGVCNLVDQRLPQNENFVLTAIKVFEGQTADGTAPQAVTYDRTLRSQIGSALVNSKVSIMEGSNVIFEQELMEVLCSSTDESLEKYYQLIEPRLLRSNRKIGVTIEVAEGQTITAGAAGQSDYMRFELIGYRTKIR